jgi:hypothetical protein
LLVFELLGIGQDGEIPMKRLLAALVLGIALYTPLFAHASALHSKTIVKVSGQVVKETKTFSVPSNWQIHWSFACNPSAGKNTFAIYMWQGKSRLFGAGLAVFKNLNKASGIKKMHQGGRLHLQIASACPFHVSVTV